MVNPLKAKNTPHPHSPAIISQGADGYTVSYGSSKWSPYASYDQAVYLASRLKLLHLIPSH